MLLSPGHIPRSEVAHEVDNNNYMDERRIVMAKEIIFKMERPGLVEQGQEVEVSESVTPFNVNYMIEPAVAMSGLFKLNNRLKTENGVTRGIVKEIVENDRGFYVTVTFPEE